MRLHFVFPFVLSLLQFTLFGQATFFAGCDDIPTPTESVSSCILCPGDSFIYGSSSGYTPSSEAGFCGSIENDQYIGFYAGPTGELTYEFRVDTCLNYAGLGIGIYDRFNTRIDDCFNLIFLTDVVFDTIHGLTPGELYYFRVDGVGGDECGFTIEILSALGSGQTGAPMATILGPDQTCTNVSTTYHLEGAVPGNNYVWELYPGPSLGNITLSDPLAITNSGTADPWLGITFDAASSSLAPGMCDTVGIRALGTNSCGTTTYTKQPSITVCRPASSPDTIYQTVMYPQCESGYVDPTTGRRFTEGVYYLPETSGGAGSTCDNVLELTVEIGGSPITIDITGSSINCNSSTYLAAAVSGGIPPYTYEWRRQLASFVPGTDTLRGMSSGGVYEVRVTDAQGCQNIAESDTLYSSLDAYLLFQDAILSITPTQCDSTGGAINIDPTILSDFDVEWSTGETNVSQITNLNPGRYTLIITDRTNQCAYYDRRIDVPVSRECFGKITGHIYYGPITSCDSLGVAMPTITSNIQLNKEDGNFFDLTRSDSNGYFEFLVPPGTYSILSENARVFRGVTEVCIDRDLLTITSDLDSFPDNDIYWRDRYNYDPGVRLSASEPIPGETLDARLTVYNGALSNTDDFTIRITSSTNLAYESGPQNALYDPVSKVVTINATDVEQGRPQYFDLTYRTDSNAQGGDPIFLRAAVDSLPGVLDDIPANDTSLILDTIPTPPSPFRMSVQPTGTGPEGFISASDSVLQYTIGFANTTGDTVTNIRVENDLSPFLSHSTLAFVNTNINPYNFTVANDKLIVNFPGVNLPPQLQRSNTNSARPVLNEGMFTFSIRLNPDLAPGTQIFNSARIYFDSLPAVHTDTSLNTIEFSSAIRNTAEKSGFLVFPNPTSGNVDVVLSENTPIVHAQLVNLNSRYLQPVNFEQSGRTGRIYLAAAQLPPGAYVLLLTLSNGNRLRQLLVVE